MFAKGSCFSNDIRCASRFMIGMIFEMLIEMFDLIDFVDLNKTVEIVPDFLIDADIL